MITCVVPFIFLVTASGLFSWLWRRERRVVARVRIAYADAERGRQLLVDSINTLPCNWAVFAPNGELVACNASYRTLHDRVFTAEPQRVFYAELMRAAAERMLPPEEVEADVAARVSRHFCEESSQFERLYPDGRWMLAHKQQLPNGHVAGFALDITDIKARERAVAMGEARYRALVDTALVAIWEVNLAGRTLFANRRLSSIFGFIPSEVSQSGLRMGPNDPDNLFGFPPEREVEAVVDRLDGSLGHVLLEVSPWFIADGAGPTCVLTMVDITSIKEMQARLEHLAGHDTLTGLPNRARFSAALDPAVETEEGCTLLLVDLDNFKLANDTHGHAAGDAILGIVAKRMAASLRGEDAAYRLGGDEFAVLIANCDRAGAELTATRLVKALGEPFCIDGQALTLSASIGIARAPADAAIGEELARKADVALYTVKRAGKAGFAFYDAHSATGQACSQSLPNSLRAPYEHV